MATSTMGYTTRTTARPRMARPVTVAGAVAAAAAVWALAVPVLGVHLLVRFGSGAPQTVGIELVVGASLLGSLLGWGFLAILERRTPRARAVWTRVAIGVLLASLSLPLSAATTNPARAALVLMHLAVAAVLIIGLRFSSR